MILGFLKGGDDGGMLPPQTPGSPAPAPLDTEMTATLIASLLMSLGYSREETQRLMTLLFAGDPDHESSVAAYYRNPARKELR